VTGITVHRTDDGRGLRCYIERVKSETRAAATELGSYIGRIAGHTTFDSRTRRRLALGVSSLLLVLGCGAVLIDGWLSRELRQAVARELLANSLSPTLHLLDDHTCVLPMLSSHGNRIEWRTSTSTHHFGPYDRQEEIFNI